MLKILSALIIAIFMYFTLSYLNTENSLAQTNQQKPIVNLSEVDPNNRYPVEEHDKYRLECDEQHITKSCYEYGTINYSLLENDKQAYAYYKKSFELGYKQAGDMIGYLQMEHKEIFTKETQPSIDETIYYLEQALDAGKTISAEKLKAIYQIPSYNRIDYKKSEYYHKIAVEQNFKNSRSMLADLYLRHLKDTTKTELSIKLLNEELFEERTPISAQGLATIHIGGDSYGGMKPNKTKTLAYLYVSKELYLSTDSHSESARRLYELVELAEKEMTPKQIQQAKELYKEIRAEMDAYAENHKE